MELEFCKHFKDATNLLLMMDHDSGYVEGVESYTSSSSESDTLKESVTMRTCTVPDNFLLSEDALLEKPEIYLDLGNFANQINNEDYEETRRLFFSPEILPSSVKSQSSSIIYSGFENETSSELSGEIPVQVPIEFKSQESYEEIHEPIPQPDISTTSASDMSLEVSMFDPVIIEKKDEGHTNTSSMSPFKGFSLAESHSRSRALESVINTKSLNIDYINKIPKEISETMGPYIDYSVTSELDNKNYTSSLINSSELKLENKGKAAEINNLTCSLSSAKIISCDESSCKTEHFEARSSSSDSADKVIIKSSLETSDLVMTKDTLEASSIKVQCCSPAPEGTKANISNDGWEVGKIPKSQTPSKINPLTMVTNTFEVSKEKRRLTLVFSKSEKENGYCVKRKYPSLTPEKNYKNPIDSYVSPDIFGDDEVVEYKPTYFEIQTQDNLLLPMTQLQTEEKYVNKLDEKLLKRTRKGMSGVPPPPSVTVIHMSVVDILTKLEENKSYFWNNDTVIKKDTNEEAADTSLNSSSESTSFSKSLLINVDLEKARNTKWSEVLNMRYHGLYHNCSKITEEIVDLCDKYQKRFVGAETQSTCTVFEAQNLISPTKRKMAKSRWGGKSPGRRLSHLARRRITFSSANLQAGGSTLAGSRARQILVDAKKIELLNRRMSPRKSPRKTPRKTPSKSPKVKTRTPSSSAKKKLAMRFRKLTGEFEKSVPSTSEVSSAHRALFGSPDRNLKSEHSKSLIKSTKRALFQSPNRDTNSSLFTSKSQDLLTSGEKNQLRRALFTSPKKMSPLKSKKSPFKHALKFGYEKKRKRSESDDMHPSKFSRSMSMDVRPSTSTSGTSKSLIRAQSELNIPLNRSQSQNELTDHHRKKLQWAVYSALQTQNITNSHPQWKVWASVLGRVTLHFFRNQMKNVSAKLEVGTTERMNRIAKRHVLSVVKGKSVEEIISDYINSRPKVPKPQGYIAPEEFNMKNKMSADIKENVFQDRVNTIESWEKKKLEQLSKPITNNKIERIRKVINFGDDR